MSAKARRQAFITFVFTILLVVMAGWLLYRYAVRFPDRPASLAGSKINVTIPSGATFPQVVRILQDHNLICNAAAFRFYVNYKGLAAKIRAGSYTLASDITPRNLLQILVHGAPPALVSVLIPEGKNMVEVADILASVQIAERDTLLHEMRNRLLLKRLSVPGDTIEGYLFPDTYKFRVGTPAQEVLTKMVKRHHAVYHRLTALNGAGLKSLRKRFRWGQAEIVTLASIVEKETGQKFERPLIAGVFLNRLTSPNFFPKLLQTDPTITYGCTVPEEKSPACKQFEGRIRRIHLDDTQNPYNTYTHQFLPPGPISNPGRAAMEAVLAPQKSKYLYFVSKNDGTHHFSATKAEHEIAVNRYQK